ncbi:hypothetical protein K0M31_011013, partial [Melipona bicolor]
QDVYCLPVDCRKVARAIEPTSTNHSPRQKTVDRVKRVFCGSIPAWGGFNVFFLRAFPLNPFHGLNIYPRQSCAEVDTPRDT